MVTNWSQFAYILDNATIAWYSLIRKVVGMDYFDSFCTETGKNKFYEEAIYGVALVYSALYNEISTHLDKYSLTPAKMNALMIIKHQGKFFIGTNCNFI